MLKAKKQLSIHLLAPLKPGLFDRYLVSQLALHWQKAGHRITTGPTELVDTDVCICHWDRTVVPKTFLPKNPHGKICLNFDILDISKRNYSILELKKGDEWNGGVIIKSNFNYFGELEWGMKKKTRLDKIRRSLSVKYWKHVRMLPPKNYPVLDNIREVPNWVWNDPNLLVEKFMPEREGEFYCLRSWLFFGGRGYIFKLFSRDKVIKVKNSTHHEFLDSEPPPELIAFRKKHRIDFGKLDYVVIDGKAIVVDLNKTPMMGSDPYTSRMANLSEGLYDFI